MTGKLKFYLALFFLGIISITPFTPLWAQENPASSAIYELDNHLKVILLPSQTGSKTATVLLTVKTGAVSEGKFLGFGISHLLEHLLFKGTEDNSETELARRVKSLGGYVNAMTSHTETQYYINLPSKNIDKALSILSGMILQTSFDPEEFLKEKNVIFREMDMNEDDPSRLLGITFFKTHYFGTAMQFPVIGYRNDFKRLSIDDVKEYYALTYQPSNMILTVCGDFEENTIRPLIKDLFAKAQNRDFFMQDMTSITRQTGTRIKSLQKPNVLSTKVMMGFQSCNIDHNDLYPLDIAAEILAGGESSRLKQKLLYTNLVNSISCYNYTPRYEGVFVFNFDYSGQDSAPMLDIIQKEIDQLKQGHISEQEIKRAVQRASLRYATGMEKTSDKAFQLTDSYLLTGTLDFPNMYIQNLKKVTVQDIARVAKTYFRDDHLTRVFLRPQPSSDENQQKAHKVVKPSHKDKAELLTLSNGIRVILKNNEDSLAAYMTIYFKGGASHEQTDKQGLSYLTSQMLKKGTSRYSQKKLAEKIELMGGAVSPISGYNAMGLNGKVINENLEEAIVLLKELLTDSAFSEKEFLIARKHTQEIIKKRNENIFPFGILKMREKLFPGHPYGRLAQGTVDSVDKLSVEQCRAYWKKALDPEQMIISIIGQYDKEKIFSLIRENFQDIKKIKHPLSSVAKETSFQPGEFSLNFPSKQSAVLIGLLAPDYLKPEKYATVFLDTFFSDQSSPLFESIRTQKGLAYATGSVYINGPFGGFFVFYCATSPDNVHKVKDILISDIQRFHKDGLTQEDFDSTFERFIAEKYFQYETPSSRAELSAFSELYGLGYDDYLRFSDKANLLSLQSINTTLKKDFRLEDAVILMIGPGQEDAP